MTPPTEFTYAGVTIPLYSSRIKTVEEVHGMPRAAVITVYRKLSKDERPAGEIKPDRATAVVQGYLERAWFVRVKKERPPMKVNAFLERAIVAALADRAGKFEKPRGPRRQSQIEITLDCIKAGMTTQEIVDAIHQEFPGSTASRFTVANYRNQLRKAGRLAEFIPQGRRR